MPRGETQPGAFMGHVVAESQGSYPSWGALLLHHSLLGPPPHSGYTGAPSPKSAPDPPFFSLLCPHCGPVHHHRPPGLAQSPAPGSPSSCPCTLHSVLPANTNQGRPAKAEFQENNDSLSVSTSHAILGIYLCFVKIRPSFI